MNAKIVLVEDDPELAEVLEYNLGRAGFLTATAGTTRDAPELIERIQPEVVILDLMLPDGDGWDICGFLAGTPELADLPVIVHTARGSREDTEMATRFRVAGFFVKPFATADVVRHVAKVVAARRGGGPPPVN
jgi:DNA-binding response OmpR family regulator